MSEKTLNEVGRDAARDYRDHIDLARRWQNSKFALDFLTSGDKFKEEQIIDRLGAGSKEEAQELTKGSMAFEQADIDRMVLYDAKFAEANSGQLHDLAVIEAHLGGIAINVEQPVSIGQAIEVDKP